MNGLASECSSGCESGWTMYLDHSSLSSNPCKKGGRFLDEDGVFCEEYKEKEAKEEDLSMISDASSGPPHFHEDEDYYDENEFLCAASSDAAFIKKGGKRQKVEQQQPHPSLLDDTASSPVFSFSKSNFSLTDKQASMENVLDFSSSFIATHFQGRSAFQKHFGFLKSFLPGKPSYFSKTNGLQERNGNEM